MITADKLVTFANIASATGLLRADKAEKLLSDIRETPDLSVTIDTLTDFIDHALALDKFTRTDCIVIAKRIWRSLER